MPVQRVPTRQGWWELEGLGSNEVQVSWPGSSEVQYFTVQEIRKLIKALNTAMMAADLATKYEAGRGS